MTNGIIKFAAAGQNPKCVTVLFPDAPEPQRKVFMTIPRNQGGAACQPFQEPVPYS